MAAMPQVSCEPDVLSDELWVTSLPPKPPTGLLQRGGSTADRAEADSPAAHAV